MKERKFRAWVKSEKRMITDTQDFPPLIVTNKGVLRLCSESEKPIWEILPSDWFELMPSTGLMDKNGVEIYEGDIIAEDDKSKFLYIVKYDTANAQYVLTGYCEYEGDEHNFDYYIPINEWGAVIGNIYENPELFEKGEGNQDAN